MTADPMGIARTLTPAMRDELAAPNPGEGNQRVVGALVRRHLLTPVRMGSQLVHELTDLGHAVRSALSEDDEHPSPAVPADYRGVHDDH